jgi:hypothetical protein
MKPSALLFGLLLSSPGLRAESPAPGEILDFIGSTAHGRELLEGFGQSGLPEILPSDRLTAERRQRLAESGSPAEEAAAELIPKGLIGNEAGLLIYSPEAPLFAAATMASHELQHALDRNAPWWLLIQGELWADFKRLNGIELDFDPESRPGEMEGVFRAYVWAGNGDGFLRGLDHALRKEPLAGALREAGLYEPAARLKAGTAPGLSGER